MKHHGNSLTLALAVAFAILGTFLGGVSYLRSRLPYNEQGTYFDGTVVLDEQAVLVFALCSVLAFGLAALSFAVFRRLSKRAK